MTTNISALFQEVLRKYNPSSKLVMYGCAGSSVEDVCSASASAGFEFEWTQVSQFSSSFCNWEFGEHSERCNIRILH